MKTGALLLALLLSACVPRELLFQATGKPAPALRDFGEGFTPPVSRETLKPVSGFGGNGGGVQRVPVIFVHGNISGADYWQPAREAFLKAGYTGDELWAVGYGWESTRALDNNTLSAVTLERFVAAVEAHLRQKTGKAVPRFDVVGHSLGVTVVREWLRQSNRWHSVRNFIGIAGANHGVWTSGRDARGQNRIVAFELHPGSAWLAQLNAIGETPGPTRYFTLYDGSGWADVLFPKPGQDSGALQGATNLAINRERGTYYGHLPLGRAAEPVQQLLTWLGSSPQPDTQAAAPEVLRAGAALTTSQPDAKLYCSTGTQEPRLAGKGEWRVLLPEQGPSSCFAWNEKTQLASPLSRHWLGAGEAGGDYAAITLTAEPPPGAYSNPVQLKLTASEPGAMIVLSSTVQSLNSGMPRHDGALIVPGPVQLTAQAIAADGRVSPPMTLDYDISIEKVDAEFAWQRQLNEDADERYAARRQQGN